MNKATIVLLVIGLVLIGGGVWAYTKWNAYAPEVYVEETTDTNGNATTTTVNTDTGEKTPGAPSYTMAQVAEHNSASSCYTVISGSVYDLTLWVNMHPGGKQAILSLCGVDGTARFMAKHGEDAKPQSNLARFKIGIVTQ